MKYIFTLLLCASIFAQDRYLDEIFEEFTVETLTYTEYEEDGETVTKEMDVYQPVGDEQEMRPLFVVCHGGSFIAGNKNNETMEYLGEKLAKRGFVVASMNYELAPGIGLLIDSLYMMDIVVKAVAQSKAVVRYFRKDAAEENLFKIQPDDVFIGGNSAGAILAMHMAYMKGEEDVPPHLWNIVTENGGLEGIYGHDGYSSNVKAVLNLAGGLNTLQIMGENDDEPVYSAHGDADDVVPFNCGDVYDGDPTFGFLDLVDICGSGPVTDRANELGIENMLNVFEGAGHVPWSNDLGAGNTAPMDNIIEEAIAMFFPLITPEEEEPVSSTSYLELPALATINGNLLQHEGIDELIIFNTIGMMLQRETNVPQGVFDLNLPKGAYILHARTGTQSVSLKYIAR